MLAALGAGRRPGQVLVGFAADEGDAGLERARAKRQAKNADLFVFNDVSRADIGFDAAENEVVVLSANGDRAVAEGAEARRGGGRARRGGAATLGSMTDTARADGPVVSRSAAGVVERVVANLGAPCARRATRSSSASSASSPRAT